MDGGGDVRFVCPWAWKDFLRSYGHLFDSPPYNQERLALRGGSSATSPRAALAEPACQSRTTCDDGASFSRKECSLRLVFTALTAV